MFGIVRRYMPSAAVFSAIAAIFSAIAAGSSSYSQFVISNLQNEQREFILVKNAIDILYSWQKDTEMLIPNGLRCIDFLATLDDKNFSSAIKKEAYKFESNEQKKGLEKCLSNNKHNVPIPDNMDVDIRTSGFISTEAFAYLNSIDVVFMVWREQEHQKNRCIIERVMGGQLYVKPSVVRLVQRLRGNLTSIEAFLNKYPCKEDLKKALNRCS